MSSNPHAGYGPAEHSGVMAPHRQTTLGVIMIIVLPITYGANEIARNAYPAQWGGPNFLAGFLDLLAIGVALGGLVLVVFGYRERHGR